MKKLKLDKDIVYILNILNANGKGYVVGGYVRDELLGLAPKDCDFVTNIPYDKLLLLFAKYNPREIGRHFGIIQITIGHKKYEIAKMRQDIGIPEKRQLQNVVFTNDIYEDLKRRDFTVNAIAYDGKNFYCSNQSIEDIENKKLRFIGDVKVRIQEDPLRILRAFRFLATKPLTPEIDFNIIKENLDLLDTLSQERIKDEFNRFLVEKDLKIFSFMDTLGVIEKIVPSWKQKSIDVIEIMKRSKNILDVRLALFFKYLGSDSETVAINEMKRLKYSKKDINKIVRLITCDIDLKKELDEKEIKKAMSLLNDDEFNMFLEMLKAQITTQDEKINIRKIKRIEEKILINKIPYRRENLAISGKTLIEVFNLSGDIIGDILNYLYDKVLDDYSINEKSTLLEMAKEKFNLK